jgi:hypothetical protein
MHMLVVPLGMAMTAGAGEVIRANFNPGDGNSGNRQNHVARGSVLSIRSADPDDVEEIESMVSDFVKGHPAEKHPRSPETLRAVYIKR